MTNKILSCLIVSALSTTLALASPAFARGGGGGGGHGGGGMGGGHGGGWGGGGMHAGGMGGGPRFGGMGGGMRFSGTRFAPAHAALAPRFSRSAFRDHRFFRHHRFNRFAFVGAPFAYAAYDTCLRRVWTPYGVRWINVCGDYGYY